VLATWLPPLGVEALLEPHADEGLVRERPPGRLTLELVDHVDPEAEVDRLRATGPRRIDALIPGFDRAPIVAMLGPPVRLLGRRQPGRHVRISPWRHLMQLAPDLRLRTFAVSVADDLS
jgi:hypothetical protein